MNYQSSNFGREGSWNENVKKKSRSRNFPSNLNDFFYRSLTYTSYKRARKKNCFYKLSSDNKILSSLIKKSVVYMRFSKLL